MFTRHRISLGNEGWYYLLVLSFIVVGASFRDANLLVALIGLMVGPLLLNWRVVAGSLKRIEVDREMPQRICAGDPLLVDITVRNERKRRGSWTLVVRDSIRLEDVPGRDHQTTIEVMLPYTPPGQSRTAIYRSQLTRRGRYRFGPLRVSTRFPLGLVCSSQVTRKFNTLIVCPRLGRLTQKWSQLIEAERVGSQRTDRRQGLVDGDYYGLREWRAGDSRRWIHWRTSAKLSQLAVRQFELQRSQDVVLVLDLWQPPRPAPADLGRVELAVSLAATAVVDLCRRGSSRVVVAAEGKTRHVWGATASSLLAREVLERLATVEGDCGTDLGRLLDDVGEQIRHTTRLVVVSTRAKSWDQLRGESNEDPFRDHVVSRSLWIDVGSPQLAEYYSLEPAAQGVLR